MIYLDSAATSYDRPKEVAQAVYDAILTMGNAGRGSHASSLTSARVIYETRRLLCELFGGPAPEQVVFTCNATEALNIAIQGLARPGIRLAATAMDHNSVLRPLYLTEQRGSTIEIVGADEKGRISLESVEQKTVCSQTGLLAVSSCPSYTEYFAKGTGPSSSCSGHYVEKEEDEEDKKESEDKEDSEEEDDSGDNSEDSGNDNNNSGGNSGNGGNGSDSGNGGTVTPPEEP